MVYSHLLCPDWDRNWDWFSLAYSHNRTRTRIPIWVWISIPKMGTVMISYPDMNLCTMGKVSKQYNLAIRFEMVFSSVSDNVNEPLHTYTYYCSGGKGRNSLLVFR